MTIAGPSIVLRSSSVAETHAIAAAIARLAHPGDLLALAGEMGSGKTAFAQGFGAALGVTDPMTSPTFTLVHSYEIGKSHLHHADVYRLERMAEVADLAISELLESDGIVLVEWGDVIATSLGDHLEVRLAWLEPSRPDDRVVTVRAIGREWASRWDRLVAALAPWREEGTAC
ncbi:MAG: tRNA (adenosine(37)-N6)-threonylcarbamoyltransferase complex ATPase subunit type 1 TsaE [Acidimicrobiia bacterium]